MEDIVVFGKDGATHDANFNRQMTRCREKGIKLNPDKTEIGKTEIPFFGHCLTANDLKIDPLKVKALHEIPAPTSKAELETVLGMITYVQKFAPNMAEMPYLLRQLLTKEA